MTLHRHRVTTFLATAVPALLTAALVAAAPASAATSAPAFPHYDHGARHADNIWAGYAATGETYTSVTGSWTVPSLNCSATPNSSVSPWIGLDGWSSQTVEQIGFDQDCTNGVAGYYPWVEMYPADSIYFTEPVAAGDRVTASVSVSGTSFTLTETDTTQGWTKTYHETGSYQLSSAEAILEDLGNRMPAVANFGTVTFSNVTANGVPLSGAGTMNSTSLERRTTMLTKNSALSGGNFSISWLHA
ncbi:G1 family glutamic endopeptidase [Kitasatospora mediocidica]|uniref:G1 family glutamic endopeptidase n=1 Tax=Kitasatospora mediocidica TaxID=58352 RepID=UPI00068A0E82|nr:G1 family glutamic endopeptidase [Kitasatospora mediocidica]